MTISIAEGVSATKGAAKTDAEIKTAYENNADTNEFSDAEQTKLTGIETAATADQTAADIRALGFFDITNDGTGSGLDADTIDGIEGATLADTDLSNLTATGNDKISTAWANFNGTGVVALRDQQNISSITDNGVGTYTANFTTNLSDSNYSAVVSSEFLESAASSFTTSGFNITTANSSGTASDADTICFQVSGGN